MSQRSTCWSVTINNPTPHDDEYIALARQRGWKVEGQLEKGAQGTPHYQLCVKTPQVRFSQVKKAFPRAHIEPARNPAALLLYTQKCDTAVAPLTTQSELYPSLSRFWELIFDRLGEVWSLCQNKRDYDFGNNAMKVFDILVRILIRDGYYVESIACNPLTRSMW